MRQIIAALILMWTAPFSLAESYAPQKVVYHINYADSSRIASTFTNMSNHIDAVGEDNIEIRAVVHGPAIEYFIAATHDQGKQIALDSIRFAGVRFIICGNTLDGYNISHEDLYDVPKEDIVQAGLPEIVRLQQQGYIYVRP